MATPEQITANQANARLSTGPVTAGGKAASSQNARKHGLSSQYLPLSEEERPAFQELEAGLRLEVNPQGALQESIFRELAAAAWKRDIVNRLLSEAAPSCLAMFAGEQPDNVRKLLRHKADQDRAFNRALRQLKEIQTALLRAATPAAQGKITKRTQSPAPNPPAEPIDLRPYFLVEGKFLDSKVGRFLRSFPGIVDRPAA